MLPNISQCPIQAPPQRTIQLKLRTLLRLRNCSQRMKIKECACPCVCVCVCVCVYKRARHSVGLKFTASRVNEPGQIHT